MNAFATKLTFVTVLGSISLLPVAKADEWNQKTVFTFSGPVEIPGQTLPAGSYVFKLANSHTNRHIVQVFNVRENHVFGTFLTIPSYRSKPSSESIIKFEERAAGSPQAIKTWFYPGRTYGHDFVYPKKEALALARVNNTPVPAMPEELTVDATKPDASMSGPEVTAILVAPLKAEEANGEEVELAEAFPSANNTQLPDRLPSTGSFVPLVGLLGLLSLAAAGSVRLVAVRSK